MTKLILIGGYARGWKMRDNPENHILPESDPAWRRCERLIQDFLRE